MAPQISRVGNVTSLCIGTSIAVVVISIRRWRIVVGIGVRIGRVSIGVAVIAVGIRIGRPAKAEPIAETAIAPAPMAAIVAESAAKMATAEVPAAEMPAAAKTAMPAAPKTAVPSTTMPLGQRGKREKGSGDENQTKNARGPHGDLPPWGPVVNARARFPLPRERPAFPSSV